MLSQAPISSPSGLEILDSKVLEEQEAEKKKLIFLQLQKAILRRLFGDEVHHIIFLTTIKKLEGNTTEQLQQLHFLIKCYLNQPAHKAFLRNGSFYNTLQRVFDSLNKYEDECIQSISDESKEKVYQTICNAANTSQTRARVARGRIVGAMSIVGIGFITIVVVLAFVIHPPFAILIGLAVAVGLIMSLSLLIPEDYLLPDLLTIEEAKKEYPDSGQSQLQKRPELSKQHSKSKLVKGVQQLEMLEMLEMKAPSDRDGKPAAPLETKLDSMISVDSQLKRPRSNSDEGKPILKEGTLTSDDPVHNAPLSVSSNLVPLSIYQSKPDSSPVLEEQSASLSLTK